MNCRICTVGQVPVHRLQGHYRPLVGRVFVGLPPSLAEQTLDLSGIAIAGRKELFRLQVPVGVDSASRSDMLAGDEMDYLLEAKGLSRRFGARWAVAGVNLRLSRGRSLLVAGHNGAGKTTLLQLLATMLRPTSGHVAVDGLDPRREALRARRAVAMLAQRNGLYLELTAQENLRVTERLMGRAHDAPRIAGLLEHVGLAGREREVVRGFSSGMRKRLAFAKVLLQDAPLVLLDEPYGQLDPAGFDFVDRLIGELSEQNRSVVVVTHIIERASALLQSGMVLDGGRMVWAGDAVDLPAAFKEAA